MIKFFRKIRRQLLEENRFSKYLIYALGEIFLVVIGILIALQINNWNESKKQDLSEKEFIEGVKNDLKQDKEFIHLVLETFEPKISAYALLNGDLNNEDKATLDSLLKVYFIPQRTFYPIFGSFQAAVAGNEINVFKNKELTRAIVKLYNSTYDRLIDNGRITDERWEYLARKYSHLRRNGNFQELNNSQLSSLLDDMFYHFAQMEWYQDNLNKAIEEIDAILLHSQD